MPRDATARAAVVLQHREHPHALAAGAAGDSFSPPLRMLGPKLTDVIGARVMLMIRVVRSLNVPRSAGRMPLQLSARYTRAAKVTSNLRAPALRASTHIFRRLHVYAAGTVSRAGDDSCVAFWAAWGWAFTFWGRAGLKGGPGGIRSIGHHATSISSCRSSISLQLRTPYSTAHAIHPTPPRRAIFNYIHVTNY